MSDLHELDDLGGTAGRDLVPPSFESLEMTARHRRRLLAGTSAVAAVAVVGVLAAGIQAVGENNAQPANPTPNRPHPTLATLVGPTTTNPATPPPVRSRTPEQIVNDPRAEIFTMAVAPDDTDVRAAAWALCPKKTCGHYLEVVAVTDDGFATTHYLGARLDTDLRWVEGGGGFAVWLRSGQLTLVSPTGQRQPVATSNTSSRLHPGETLIRGLLAPRSDHFGYLGVNGSTGQAHPLPPPSPNGRYAALTQMGGQLLWGTVNLNTVISSADGGATWRPGYSPERYNQLDSIDSADPQTLALVPAGDDDSKQPGTLYRSTDGGATWATLHPAQFHDSGAGWAAVLPDGRLLITVMTPFGSLSAKPELYESDSTSWLSFHRVGGSSPLPNGWLILTTVDAGGHGSLWLDGGDRFSISTDEGRAWHVTPMR